MRPADALAGRPAAAWLVGRGTSLRRGEARERVQAQARAWREAGLRPGDRAGWWPEPEPAALCAALALLEAGAELVLLPRREPAAVLERETRRLELRVAVGIGDLPCPCSPAGEVRALPGAGAAAGQSAGVLLRSSGSLGEPRWIGHGLAGLAASARGAARHLGLEPLDTWRLGLPLDRVGGFAVLMRSLVSGCRLQLPAAGGGPDDTAPGESAPCSRLSLVPAQLHRLLEQGASPAGLRSVLMGGAPLPPALARAARAAGWPLVEGYGASESGAVAAAGPWPPRGGGEALRPLSHVRLALDGEGRVGLASPALFRCELDVGGRPRPRRGEWWWSGDLARWAEGGLRILGRADRVIFSGGEKVRPEEVEAALEGLPGVRRAVVVAVPDAEYGQRPVAFVAWTGEARDLAWVRDGLRDLARHKHPVRLFPWTGDTDGKPPLARLAEEARRRWGRAP